MAIDFSRNVAQIEADSKAIEVAIHAAVRDALIEHKQLGQPIVVADENGNPVWVAAEEIEIPILDEEIRSVGASSSKDPR